ncbi:hypothetical protein F0342_03985 [Bacillus sp. CH30_1T]|uniref:DUF5344 family protein n=1 Tax=Bacillus sp. CH30_1T TaxID=2604836 RepID=UPI0011EFA740|nr:DUF5344 family protein [Bacillus sp. CH30_1T]KAA0565856.1 hypothetical protein F0342_03985 [Bacillus sp. CH30_1T]
MSQDIKLRFSDINEALADIQAASESFETSLAKDIASSNQLDVVRRLNELSHLFEEVANVYKSVLIENNQSASKAIEDFIEVDHTISASIMSR